MNRRQVWRRVSQVWITLGLLATVVFAGWSLVAYRASSDARAAIQSGHSRGAVVASTVAAQHRRGVAGLVLIASSHPRDVDLSGLRVGVTKIVGTRDGLASPAEVEANRGLLPAQTRWVWVEGGNHSQFGWYGFQPGDRRARIDAAEQRRLMTDAVIDALRSAAVAVPAR